MKSVDGMKKRGGDETYSLDVSGSVAVGVCGDAGGGADGPEVAVVVDEGVEIRVVVE